MIHLEGLDDCHNCSKEFCIFDYDRTDPRRREGCDLYPPQALTGTEIMQARHKQSRIKACEMISEYIKKHGHMNIKDANHLTGISKITIAKWLGKHLNFIREKKQVLITGVIQND